MASHKQNADLIDRFAQLIKDHEELKRQYATLQTNFNMLAGDKIRQVFQTLEKLEYDREPK